VYAVTDLELKSRVVDDRVMYAQVPAHYRTLRGSRYKARALEYLLRTHLDRNHPGDGSTWVLHLDEESCLTRSAIAGISAFVSKPENNDRIGQGEIKYNGYGYARRPFIAVVDSVRTGDDLGRFRLQFRLFRRPVFGMHGSYFLVPLHIESDIGFDLSERGSVTEDAYFALIASTRYQFGWVDGYIREQSPFTLRDIIKQRRRWFNGLSLLVRDPIVARRHRAVLWAAMLTWAVGWVSPLVTAVNLFVAGSLVSWLIVPAAFTQGAFVATYAVGAYRNVADTDWGLLRRTGFVLLSMVLMPFATLVEGAAVIYGLVRPVTGFDVVSKDAA
jgi:hypothetical protein